MFSVGDRDVHKPQDRLRWPLAEIGTSPILNSAPQWSHRPCNVPMWFYRISKKPSVKTDLAIYSHVVDVSEECLGASLICFNLDFSSSNNLISFCKSSHIYMSTDCKALIDDTKFNVNITQR